MVYVLYTKHEKRFSSMRDIYRINSIFINLKNISSVANAFLSKNGKKSWSYYLRQSYKDLTLNTYTGTLVDFNLCTTCEE